jgi:hypothetical protein
MPQFTTDEMADMLKAAAEKIKVGSRWQHYKGGVYETVDFTILTATDEVGVVYRRIAGPGFVKGSDSRVQFCRPLSEWFEMPIHVTDDAPPTATQRFMRVEKREVWMPVPEEEAGG